MNNIEKIKCIRLAEQIASLTPISNELKEAISSVPRTIFAPAFADAFSLDAHLLEAKQWISSPLTVAKMSQILDVCGCDKVLEIGCGTGYQAAILSKIARRVFSIERVESLAKSAKTRLAELEINNVFIRFDDGSVGWSSFAPFERILLSCSCKAVPEVLFNQLELGGVLVAPVEISHKQYITKFTKISADNIKQEQLEPCEFVPLLQGRA